MFLYLRTIGTQSNILQLASNSVAFEICFMDAEFFFRIQILHFESPVPVSAGSGSIPAGADLLNKGVKFFQICML